MNFSNLNGQTLDEKYRIEREIGRGGMGTVYLATHVGTERPVALKIIAPQFMERVEFVERFRREARAAGRLRHPNVVNVTDFGFADTDQGKVAYLVMEYLDGVTLGEILTEEKKIPLEWTIDILEQVCSAVHEAHAQGIIHRDLKPDNIWLEPNQRGGYTVKVLDFGIAKLEESVERQSLSSSAESPAAATGETNAGSARATVAGSAPHLTFAHQQNYTEQSEAATALNLAEPKTLIAENAEASRRTLVNAGAEDKTLISNADFAEQGTAILEQSQTLIAAPEKISAENAGTKILTPVRDSEGAESLGGVSASAASSGSAATKELTRVGAVLGTPLYMSPEQCRGEKLSAQSDIYSLGIIAYQMLAGKTPFDGDFTEVMRAHREVAAPPLNVKKIPSKIKKVVSDAMAKDASERPPTAQAFAAEMRAQSEGIGTLLRNALELYGRHLPKFLLLSVVVYLPLTIFTIAQVSVSFLPLQTGWVIALKSFIGLATVVVSFTCGSLAVGTTTWLVAQILAFPLKPVHLRPALAAARRQWKKLFWTSFLQSILVSIGYAMCLVPGLVMTVIWGLASAVVMMENYTSFAALKRSKKLVMRSLRTTVATTLIMFFVPVFTSLMLAYFANLVVKDFSGKLQNAAVIKNELQKELSDQKTVQEQTAAPAAETAAENNSNKNVTITLGPDKTVRIAPQNDAEKAEGKFRNAVSEALQTIIYLPISIVLISFFTIVSALLYFKSRQAGGETMQDLLGQFEEADRPRSQWQQRVQNRLVQSGRMTSKT